MIASVTGRVLAVTDESVLIERDGIAWELSVPQVTRGELIRHGRGLHPLDPRGRGVLGGLPPGADAPGFHSGSEPADPSEMITLHTVFYLEGTPAGTHLTPRLLGFLSETDRAFFQELTRIKGISARRALRAMAVPTATLAQAIEHGDLRALTALPEIGRKTAEQIVATLRGHLQAFVQAPAAPRTAPRAELSDAQRTAVDILVQWGDRRPDAERLVSEALAEDASLSEPESIVRASYRIRTRSRV